MANDLATPFTRPFGQESKGGNQPGLKDGVALGSGNGSEVSTPFKTPWPSQGGSPSTAGGPVGLQVTEDVQGVGSKSGSFPSGTSSKE
jgi:hypothetical protein